MSAERGGVEPRVLPARTFRAWNELTEAAGGPTAECCCRAAVAAAAAAAATAAAVYGDAGPPGNARGEVVSGSENTVGGWVGRVQWRTWAEQE